MNPYLVNDYNSISIKVQMMIQLRVMIGYRERPSFYLRIPCGGLTGMCEYSGADESPISASLSK